MIINHRGNEPQVHEKAFIAPTAVIVGKVTVAGDARVMYGAVADSEGSNVAISGGVIICENAVLRATAEGDRDHPVVVGDHAFIGPHATLLGCEIGSAAYIATGATVLQGATIGSGAVVAVGALVHANTVIPKGFFVPPHTVAIGDPVRIYGSDKHEAMSDAIKAVGFPAIAFRVTGSADPVERTRRISEVRGREFGSHFNDSIPEER